PGLGRLHLARQSRRLGVQAALRRLPRLVGLAVHPHRLPHRLPQPGRSGAGLVVRVHPRPAPGTDFHHRRHAGGRGPVRRQPGRVGGYGRAQRARWALRPAAPTTISRTTFSSSCSAEPPASLQLPKATDKPMSAAAGMVVTEMNTPMRAPARAWVRDTTPTIPARIATTTENQLG